MSSLQRTARSGEACIGAAHVTEPNKAASVYSATSLPWGATCSLQPVHVARSGEVTQAFSCPCKTAMRGSSVQQPPCNRLTAISAVTCLIEVQAVVM